MIAFIRLFDVKGEWNAAVNIGEIAAFEADEDPWGNTRIRVTLKSGEPVYGYESLADFVQRLDEVVRAMEDGE